MALFNCNHRFLEVALKYGFLSVRLTLDNETQCQEINNLRTPDTRRKISTIPVTCCYKKTILKTGYFLKIFILNKYFYIEALN